jgi:hypothetical protein
VVPATLPPIAQDVLAALAADARVTHVWLGGSHAHGTADAYSDIDLCIAATDWSPTSFGSLWLAGQPMRMAGMPFWHGMLRDGTILDVLVGEPYEGYQPLPLPSPALPPPGEPEPSGAATEFWINSSKHRKVLARNLWPMAIYGLHHDRMLLLRLWTQEATGQDPGPPAFSIHGMTPLVRQYVDEERARLLGMPCQNQEQLIETIHTLREEASRSIKASETKWAIPRPHRLEELVRSLPLGLR